MNFIYWLSKFSQEAMLVELFLIACLGTAFFGYMLSFRRKHGVGKKQVPDHIVRAFLADLLSRGEGFKTQIFGENFKINPAEHAAEPVAAQSSAVAATGASSEEMNILRAQLQSSTGKLDELTKALAALTTDKAALEAKLAATPAPQAASGAAPGNNSDLIDKIAKLETRLAEYEVIEDDLANLKKYQQENKQLRAELDALKKDGAVAAATPAQEAAAPAPVAEASPEPAAAAEAPAPAASAAAPAAEAPAPASAQPAPAAAEPTVAATAPAEPSPIAAAEQTVESTLDTATATAALAEKTVENLAPPAAIAPAGASVADTVAPQAAPEAVTADSSNAAGDSDKTKNTKSDADLLNEFERMLSS